ncbi:MAG: translocation/assembly module TamB domain-containing protein [Terriglobales bacterium]
MTENAPNRAKRRWVALAAIAVFALVSVLLAAWYVASPRFEERMRRRVVAELEQMTGARAELKSFHWRRWTLQFEARGLTLHGLESADQAPYAQVDRLWARLKILSVFRRQVGLRELTLEHPVVHIIVYPDGSTNQPAPGKKANAEAVAGVLFELAIHRVQVAGGELLWNDRRVPLDFTASGLRANMLHHTLETTYRVHIQAAAVETRYGEFPAVRGKVDAQLSLASGRADLTSFKFTSQGSTLEAHGTLSDFRDPKVQLAYSGSLDVFELGGLLRLPELRRGKLEVSGQGRYHAPDFASTGRVVLKGGEWRNQYLRLPDVTAAAHYVLTRDRAVISDLNAQALGGLISGNAEVTQWGGDWSSRHLPGFGGCGKNACQRGAAHLRVSGMQAGALAVAVSTSTLHLDRINPAGAARGTIDVEWSGSPRDLNASFALEVEPPANPRPGQLPVSAQAKMVYHGQAAVLDIAQLNMEARSTRFQAAGVLGSTSTRLSVTVNTGDLGELRPVLAALHEPAVPLEMNGRASFNGSIIGRLSGPTVRGDLEITDFDTVFAAAPRVAPGSGWPNPPQRIHWDSLTADVAYSPAELSLHRGLLRRGEEQASFDVSAALRNGELQDTSTLHGRVDIRGADLQDVQALAGSALPITGKVTLSATLGGTRASPAGEGTLRIDGGTLAGEPFQSVRAAWEFAGPQVGLHDIVLTRNGAQLTGSLAYNFGDRAFNFDLTGTNFQLAKFPRLQQPLLSVAGTAAFHLQGTGTTAAPVIEIELHIRDMLLNQEPTGDFDLTGETHGADLHLTARSHFQTAELAIDGDVRLRGDFPAQITLRFSHLDVDPLLRAYLAGKVTGHSSIAGALDLRGPLRRPRDLNLTGHVDHFSAELEKVAIETDGPIQITLANESLTLDRLHLKGFNRAQRGQNGGAGPTSDLTAGGVIQLGGDQEMNFHANGVLDFALLQSFAPDLTSSGKMEINFAVGGTLARPETRGQVRIINGAVSYIDLPNGLSNVNGTLAFQDNRLRVESLSAQTGGGTLTLGGFISYSRGLSFNLTATSKDIRLRYPPGVSSYADADLRFTGTPDNSLLAGTVTITRFNVSQKFDLAYYMQRVAQAPNVANPQSPLNNLHFDLHIVTAQELQVEMTMAKLSGIADLRLRGTAYHPVLLGRVDIAQGNIDIAGTKYHLERGDIVFSSPTTIAPVIDLEATARVRDYDISLGVHGAVAHPHINYRSDPPLPTSDIIALLALGRTQEQAMYYQTGPSQSLNELTSNAVLEQALASAYSSRAQRLFGASRVKIDPQAGEAANNPNARVTIEQQVSDKVTLTFISNVSQSAQQIIQVEYNINRRLSVVAVRDQNGVLSFDVRYRQRRR